MPPAAQPAARPAFRSNWWRVGAIGFAAIAAVAAVITFALGPSPVSGPRQPVGVAVLPFADLSPTADRQYFADGVQEEIITRLTGIPDAPRRAARDRERVSRRGQAGERDRARARRPRRDARNRPVCRGPRARYRAADRRANRHEHLGRRLRPAAHAREPVRHPSRDRGSRRRGSHALARGRRHGSARRLADREFARLRGVSAGQVPLSAQPARRLESSDRAISACRQRGRRLCGSVGLARLMPGSRRARICSGRRRARRFRTHARLRCAPSSSIRTSGLHGRCSPFCARPTTGNGKPRSPSWSARAQAAPEESGTVWSYAYILSLLGRHDEAIQQVRTFAEASPDDARNRQEVAGRLIDSGRFADATEAALAARALNGEPGQVSELLGTAAFGAGDLQTSITELERAVALQRGAAAVVGRLAAAYARAGRESDARALLAEARSPCDRADRQRRHARARLRRAW